mmetsp:Transcript_55360/g.61762  ORF Transcript_55360/g.61762 Transcript_55360/m.61762 type:complete len:648 (+) Transcript_55360:3-1946(+)
MRVKNLLTKFKCQLSQYEFPISPSSSVQFLPKSSSSFSLFERNGILPFSSMLNHSSFQRRRRRQQRSYSDTDDRTASNASALLVLEKAASAAKEHVAKCTNEKTIHDFTSCAAERRKKCHFLPQLRGVTKNLLNVTEAVDSLSHSIEGIRMSSHGGNKDNINTKEDAGRSDLNKSAETCLRELHRAFLNLTQALLNHYEAMMEENCHKGRVDRFHLLESVLAVSYRAHQLSLPYHWPLYQRLAIVVAKHQTPIDENITIKSTTMNSLTTCSRAEWIQKIHRWSIFPRGSGSDNGDYIDDGRSVLQTKNSDLEWFYSPLKVLAVDGRWSDFSCILMDLLRPVSDNEDYTRDLHTRSNKGRNYRQDTLIAAFEDDYDSDNDDDCTVTLSSPTAIPFLAEEFTRDILLQLERQGLLANLWRRENGSRYPPSYSVNQTCDILFTMEASIWNIFGNSYNNKNVYSDKVKSVQKNSVKYNPLFHCASLRDAIEFLLANNGPKNISTGINDNEEDNDDDNDDDNDNDGDCLVKTLEDWEDLLNDQQDVNDDDENERQSQQASDALALATELSNQMLPNIISDPSTEDFLSNDTDDDYLDFIYDDRAEDYRDNIPDVTSQLYLNNGNQELLYTSSLERHIYEDIQSPGGYNSDKE